MLYEDFLSQRKPKISLPWASINYTNVRPDRKFLNIYTFNILAIPLKW